jgi:beta-lactamase class A
LTLPKAPRPVLYGIRLLVIGVGVAAIAGTLLSVLTPADSSSDPMNTAQTASRTASAITAETGEPLGKTELRLTQEITPLQAKLADLQNLTPGLTASIYLVDLDTGKYVNLGGEQAIAAASTIKLPILLAFFQAVDAGQITVDQILTLQPTQVAGGSGNMQGQPPGAQYTALEVATQMIINSDNTATNMIIDLLGGPEVLNQHFLDWGLTATVLRNPLPDLSGTNTTSTQDLVQTIALVNQGELLSLRSRDRVMNILQRTYNKSLIPAGLGEGSVSYNKTGDIGSILGDAALVDLPNGKRYAIATLVQRPENDGRARELIRRISQTVYQEMHIAIVPALPPSNAEPATGTPTNPAPLNSDAAGAPPER